MARSAYAASLFLLLGLASCAVPDSGSVRPAWIDNPGKGVSASAGMHVGGRIAQEELAILRGREEYARRYGVSIESEQVASTTVVNDSSSTVAHKVTKESTSQSGIKVMLKEKWREPGSDVIWVWLVPTE